MILTENCSYFQHKIFAMFEIVCTFVRPNNNKMGYPYKYQIEGYYFTIYHKPYIVWECPFSGDPKYVDVGDVFIEIDFYDAYYVYYYYDEKLNETYKVKAK